MNLQETIRALNNIKSEQYPQGLTIALDVGVHQCCDVDSNCPVAIKLRGIVAEANVSLQELLEGYARVEKGLEQEAPTFSLDGIDYGGSVFFNVAGQSIEVDLSNQVRERLEGAGRSILDKIEHESRHLVNYGRGFHHTCMSAIAQARATEILPQLQFNFADLLKYKPLVTTEEHNYLVSLPIKYKPEWLYHNSTRYAMSKEDVVAIEHDIFVVFPVTKDKRTLRPYLVNAQGRKFRHYHGNAGDCWGKVKLPEVWDGSLRYLVDIAYQLQASLATINLSSLMSREPLGMPSVRDLQARATELGQEGVARTPTPEDEYVAPVPGDETTTEPIPQTRHGWGRTGEA